MGLTGGLGSGKSTVSDILRGQGLDVLDADQFAREVVQPGTFGLSALVEIFGSDILKGGELNRSLLAEKIFSDEGSRLVVERVIHPLIQWRVQQELVILKQDKRDLIFYDAALIFEKNLVNQFDSVVVVHCPAEVQIQRVMNRDKISKEVATKRLASQWPLEKKMSAAQFLIDNGGSREDTKRQTLELIKKLKNS